MALTPIIDLLIGDMVILTGTFDAGDTTRF